jgi:hypothetical protein
MRTSRFWIQAKEIRCQPFFRKAELSVQRRELQESNYHIVVAGRL